MKPETGDLLRWGFSQTQPTERTPRTDMELKLSSMKSALMERRVLHADDFKNMFGWDERACRSIAAASEGYIISTHDGYLLTAQADPEEFAEANGRIYSQAKNMLRRAIQERRVRHQMVGRA
jgi:hypothetical protein